MTFAEIKDRLSAIEVGLTTLAKRQEELVRYILLQVDKNERQVGERISDGEATGDAALMASKPLVPAEGSDSGDA